MNKKILFTFSLSLSSLILISCTTTGPIVQPAKGLPADLQEQIDKTSGGNANSARNNMIKAKILYGELLGKWNSMNPIDTDSFKQAKETLAPTMFAIANAINSSNSTEYNIEFRDLYFDSLTNMMKGINNNLFLYQSFLENTRSVTTIDPERLKDVSYSEEEIIALSSIFQATEDTLYYVAQLAQFTTLVSKEESDKILGGLKNQQNSIISGLIGLNTQNRLTSDQAKKSYEIVIKSLISPRLLETVKNLAVAVFGEGNVSYKQDALTPEQSNPNLIVMVIKESKNTYRLVNIDSSGKVVNKLVTDDRGLSAADIQNQTNINIVKVK